MVIKIDISEFKLHSAAANKLLTFAGAERVFLFDAPMGAGKTTFIKAVCNHLEVQTSMSSPTYAIINEYKTLTAENIFHFDLYRIISSDELLNLGFEEYLEQDAYVFIEWPKLAIPFLTSYVKVDISINNKKRYLNAEIITT